jgi:hypothetical protein
MTFFACEVWFIENDSITHGIDVAAYLVIFCNDYSVKQSDYCEIWY